MWNWGREQGAPGWEDVVNRAMKLDTNSYAACRSKIYYLEPKWHGSPEEMIAFGRQCVQSTKLGGRCANDYGRCP